MIRRSAFHVLPLALAACCALACDGKGGGEGDSAAQVDTTNQDQLDGVSSEQLQAEAKAMTPEEAAARGMIDTTTHLEQLGSPDSTPAGTAGTRPPPIVGDDTTGRPPRDSVRRP